MDESIKDIVSTVLESNDIDCLSVDVNEEQQLIVIHLDKAKPGQVESVVEVLRTELGPGLDADWLGPNEGTIMINGKSYYVSVVV